MSINVTARAVASSSTYRFLVGPDREEFFVHEPLIVHASPVLKAMVSSGLQETIERTIKWDDVDVQAFVSFWQFLYTSTYDDPDLVPELELLSESEPLPLPDPAPEPEPVYIAEPEPPVLEPEWSIPEPEPAVTVNGASATQSVGDTNQPASAHTPPSTKVRKNKKPRSLWRKLPASDSYTKEDLSREFEKLNTSSFLPGQSCGS